MAAWDRRTLGVAGLVLAVILFLAVNIFANGAIRNLQADLTEKSLYSVSAGTEKVLADLKEPVTLRYFVSRSLIELSPGLGTYSQRVLELLQRYVDAAGGKIRLEIVDPKPFSNEEDRAVGFGLQGVPLNDAGELGYFGLAGTNTTDDQDVIGFLQPQREPFLEYDLTRLVHNLAHPKKKVIGLVSGIPIDADPANQYKPWRVVEQIKQFFEIKSLGLEPEISDDIDVLMIVHPFGLSDKTLYAIDQFVMAGGKTMVFVDPYAEEGSRSNAAMRLPPDQGSNLEKLFKAWGVDYVQDRVLADLGLAQRVQAEVDAQGRPVITNYVSWLSFPADRLKADDVITGQLQAINVATAGFLAKAKDADIAFDPLIVSTEASAPMDAQKFRFQPNPAEILKEFAPEEGSLTLAARLSGKLKSAFPDGPPEDKDNKDEAEDEKAPAKPHLAESADVVNLIVVADSDILADTFWLQIQDFFGQRMVVPTANNADFVINALDNLSGSSELIGLRSRGFSDRPFDRVIEIQRAAELQYRDRERALLEELKEVEGKLKDLTTKEQESAAVILTDKQQQAIEDFRRQIIKVRGELRDVRRALREDIDTLDGWIKILNIAAMPALIALLAIGLLIARNRRTRRRYAGSVG
ncbi:MAG: Gldg family protein [Defluviicoccus sp.]|nr:Gldg family protein [Defluviicoccus sp.]MDE0386653.1 Gldg family protein [Defluviicoccus sp.]